MPNITFTFDAECTYINKPLWRKLFKPIKPEAQVGNQNLVRELGKALRRGARKAKGQHDQESQWWTHRATA